MFVRETASIIFALKRCRHHLLRALFVVFNDQKSLSEIRKVNIYGQLAQLLDIMAEYGLEILRVDGNQDIFADYISRSVAPSKSEEEEKEGSIKHFSYKGPGELFQPAEKAVVMIAERNIK